MAEKRRPGPAKLKLNTSRRESKAIELDDRGSVALRLSPSVSRSAIVLYCMQLRS